MLQRARVRQATYGYVGHLAERVVLEVSGLLLIAPLEADVDEFVGNVAFFGY
jgi:hypothetical protein